MKTKTRKQSPPPDLGSRINMTAWRKHYVSSVTAEDEAWPQREPGSNLGRIFVLLLLLHVFIIGAVVLYNIISPKAPLAMRDPKPQTTSKPSVAPPVKTETASTAAKVTTPPAKPVAATHPAPLKGESPVIASAPVAGLFTYEVKSGDNVPAIASNLGVNAEDLVKWNNLDTTTLYPGRKLEYQKPAALAPIASPAPIKVKAASTNNNVVTSAPKPKPAVLKVADKEKEKAAVDNLPKARPLSIADSSSDSVPKAVPVKSMSHVEDQPPAARPKVKSNTEDAPPAKAKSETKNKDKSDEARAKARKAGKSDASSKTASKTEKSSKDSSGKRSHVVGVHETLYSISKKFGVSVSALQKANDIKDPTRLRDGSKIIIPSKN